MSGIIATSLDCSGEDRTLVDVAVVQEERVDERGLQFLFVRDLQLALETFNRSCNTASPIEVNDNHSCRLHACPDLLPHLESFHHRAQGGPQRRTLGAGLGGRSVCSSNGGDYSRSNSGGGAPRDPFAVVRQDSTCTMTAGWLLQHALWDPIGDVVSVSSSRGGAGSPYNRVGGWPRYHGGSAATATSSTYDCVLLDEAQTCSGPKGGRAEAASPLGCALLIHGSAQSSGVPSVRPSAASAQTAGSPGVQRPDHCHSLSPAPRLGCSPGPRGPHWVACKSLHVLQEEQHGPHLQPTNTTEAQSHEGLHDREGCVSRGPSRGAQVALQTDSPLRSYSSLTGRPDPAESDRDVTQVPGTTRCAWGLFARPHSAYILPTGPHSVRTNDAP